MAEKRFTLKTSKGSWNLFILFIALILIFSFCANLIFTNGHKIQISNIVYEVRGGELHFELYKPADVSSEDKYPCMILSHGGSESLAANSLNAWEFARRGFVVMNVSMYSCGESEQPAINDDGTCEENYFRGGTQGMYDALQYARQLSYVDSTRIGMWGHSAGYYCNSAAVIQDNECLTLNDRMLNVLHDELGVEISEDQLTEDADEIAKAVLSDEQMAFYEYCKAEQKDIVDHYVKAARLVEFCYAQTVNVAGYEVVRDPQINLMSGLGTHEDGGSYYLGETDDYKNIFHTGGAGVARNGWYQINDYTREPGATSDYLGTILETTVSNSNALKSAIDNGSARYFLSPTTFHNGMLWDWRALDVIVEFFTQTLGYNNGNIGEAGSRPIPSTNHTISYIALLFTTLSFLCAIGMLIALASILLKTEYFKVCFTEPYEAKLSTKDKNFWITVAFAFIAAFIGAFMNSQANLSFSWSNATATKWLPWEPGQMRTMMMISFTALSGLVLFLILFFVNKARKKEGLAKISDVRLGFGVKPIWRTIVLSCVLFMAIYLMAAVIKVCFNSRFVFADGSFEMMKPFAFMRTVKYALILLPFTLIISCMNNMWSLKNVSDTKDTVLNTVITSIGAIVFVLISVILTYSAPQHAVVFERHTLLPIFILAPVMSYLYRKLFKLTGSVWAGALIVSLILGWRLSSYISHQFIYWGPNLYRAFWGFY